MLTFPILREKVAVEVQKQLDVIACKLLESNMKAKKRSDEIAKFNQRFSIWRSTRATFQTDTLKYSNP